MKKYLKEINDNTNFGVRGVVIFLVLLVASNVILASNFHNERLNFITRIKFIDFSIHWGKIGLVFFYVMINLIVLVPLILGVSITVYLTFLMLSGVTKDRQNRKEALDMLFVFLMLALFIHFSFAGFSDFFTTFPITAGYFIGTFIFGAGAVAEMALIFHLFIWLKDMLKRRQT